MVDIERVEELRQAINDATEGEDIAQAIHNFRMYLLSNNDIEQALIDENQQLKVDNGVIQRQLEHSRAINSELRAEVGMNTQPKPAEEDNKDKDEPVETNFEQIMSQF